MASDNAPQWLELAFSGLETQSGKRSDEAVLRDSRGPEGDRRPVLHAPRTRQTPLIDARQRASEARRPGLPTHDCRRAPGSRVPERPVVPCRPPASRGRRRRMRASASPARMTPASATAVRRSSDESPEPSTMPHALRRVCRRGPQLRDARSPRPRALVPDARLERAEVLEEHLGGEVVAVAVHRARRSCDSRAEWSPGEPYGAGRRHAEPGRPGDATLHARRGRRGATSRLGAAATSTGPAPCAVDDERRERRRSRSRGSAASSPATSRRAVEGRLVAAHAGR